MKTLGPFLLALALLGACSDDPPPPVEPEPAPPEQPAAPAPAAPANLEPSENEVPIVEDFEEEAEREVKPDNLSAQLDALEQEIELDSK